METHSGLQVLQLLFGKRVLFPVAISYIGLSGNRDVVPVNVDFVSQLNLIDICVNAKYFSRRFRNSAQWDVRSALIQLKSIDIFEYQSLVGPLIELISGVCLGCFANEDAQKLRRYLTNDILQTTD